MQAKGVMTQSPAFCLPRTGLQDVAQLMVQHDCGAIPVIENENTKAPVGVVTDRDITCRAVANGKNPLQLTAEDCMTQPAATIAADASVEDCCQAMQDKQVRRMLVVDDRGQCCGIVAQADIAQHAPEHETASVVKEVSRG